MKGKVNFSMRGRSELTKKRHQVGVLLKSARKGRKEAKDKLFKEFNIRVYSPEEVEEYVKEKMKTELLEELPSRIRTKNDTRRKKGR